MGVPFLVALVPVISGLVSQWLFVLGSGMFGVAEAGQQGCVAAVLSHELDGTQGVVVGLVLGVAVVCVIRVGSSSQDLGCI